MSESNELDIRRYIRLVFARKGLFALVAFVVMTTAVAGSYSLPKVYEAKSTVFIEKNVINDLVQGIAITPSLEAKIKVLTVAMLSRTLLLEVVRELDMDLGFASEQGREEFIKALQYATRINLDEERGLFVISYQNEDPRTARDYVNTLVRRYIEQNVSSKREESYQATQFLAEQIDNFKDRIDLAEEALNAYKVEKGMLLATDDGTLRREISEAEDKLEQLSIRKTELLASRRVIETTDPLVEQQRGLEKRLDTLRALYTESYPEVQKTRAALEALNGRIQGRSAEYGVGREDPHHYEQIQVELNSIEQQEAALKRNIAANRQMLREIPTVRARLNELHNEKENQRLIYEQLVTRYGQSEVSKQMEIQDKSATFRVVDPAIMPYKPVSPNRPRIIAMGVMGGFGSAFGLLLLLGKLNPAVKSVSEVKGLGLRVMAVIPRIRDPREVRRQRRRDRWLYLFFGLYLSLVLAVLVVEFLGLPHIDAYVEQLDLPGHVARLKAGILG